MKKFAFLLIAAQLAFVSPAPAQSIDSIAAVVNEDVILRSEVKQATDNIIAQNAARAAELPPRDILEGQVLERLIMMRLQLARASSSGMRIEDAEVDQAVAGLAQQNNMTTAQLIAQATKNGMSEQAFRRTIADELLLQRMKMAYAQSTIRVSESEVDNALSSMSEGGTQYHLANIVVALPEGATAEQIDAGQKKIEAIKAQLDNGELDFTAAAMRFSNGSNALDGGDLGWRAIEEVPPAFAQQLAAMKQGDILGPVRGTTGFQLLKLVEVRENAGASNSVTQYRVQQILIKSADPANDNAARAKAETLHARLVGGADFAKLAKSDSDDTASKDRGGELDWRSQDGLGEVGATVAGLADNGLSAPIQTAQGWVIVKRLGTRQGVAASDDQRAQVRDMIGRRKLEESYDRFLREMRGEAYVEIRRADGSPESAPVTTPAPAPAN